MNIRKFRNDTWDFAVHIVWPVTPAQFQRYVCRVDDPSYKNPGPFSALCYYGEPILENIIIGFAAWKNQPRDLGLLAHETFHATHRVLAYKGMNLTGETCEAFAYLQESIFNNCLRRLQSK